MIQNGLINAWETPELTSLNKLAPRATFHACATAKQALALLQPQNAPTPQHPRRLTLDGQWQLHIEPTPADAQRFIHNHTTHTSPPPPPPPGPPSPSPAPSNAKATANPTTPTSSCHFATNHPTSPPPTPPPFTAKHSKPPPHGTASASSPTSAAPTASSPFT